MLVLLEGFLGQFINVVAIGLWLSGVKGSDDLKTIITAGERRQKSA
ncbi:MAG: hypothetical protein ACLRXQ_01530 [Phascolarctobacterium faecium]